jgi:hypothetical protein
MIASFQGEATHYPAFLGLLILAKQVNSIVDEKLCARYIVDIQNAAAFIE